MSSSYNIKNVATSLHREVDRLEGQLNLFLEKELAYYQQCGLLEGMSVLDCGSGPGHLVLRLSNAFPKSEIHGLEIDPVLVEISENLLNEKKFSNCHISEGSIMETGFDDNRFDFIISRLVLEHLPDPISAVKEVNRILKPGGVAVFVANDFAYHLRTSPDIPELEDLYRAYCRCRIDEGGNPYVGRELPVILDAAGMSEIGFEIISAHSSFTGDRAFLKSEGAGISNQLIKDGYLDKKIFDSLVIKWQSILSQKGHSIIRQLFYCSGKKNDGASTLNVSTIENQASRSTSKSLLAQRHKDHVGTVDFDAAVAYLHELIVEALEVDPNLITNDIELEEIGLDSLSAATMQAHIESDFGLDISISDFFNGQSITSLSRMLIEKMEQKKNTDQEYSDRLVTTGGQPGENSQGGDWEEGEI